MTHSNTTTTLHPPPTPLQTIVISMSAVRQPTLERAYRHAPSADPAGRVSQLTNSQHSSSSFHKFDDPAPSTAVSANERARWRTRERRLRPSKRPNRNMFAHQGQPNLAAALMMTSSPLPMHFENQDLSTSLQQLQMYFLMQQRLQQLLTLPVPSEKMVKVEEEQEQNVEQTEQKPLISPFSIDNLLSVEKPCSPPVTVYTLDALETSDGRARSGKASSSEPSRCVCDECGKSYATSSNLSRHKQTHRPLDSPLAKQCPHCDRVYVSMPALSMHILTHKASHECNICGKVFSRLWLLQGHQRSHTGARPFGCAHCGKSFADRSNLRAHILTHTGEKKFSCDRCGKRFALRSYLHRHRETACMKRGTCSPENSHHSPSPCPSSITQE